LALTDQVVLKDATLTLEALATRLKGEHQAALAQEKPPVFSQLSIPYKGERETYYSYCATHSIHNFGKQHLVINFRTADLSDSPQFYTSNCLQWQAGGITRIRRHRWPVEVYHEEGKEEGLDQYQVRDFQAISRHISLVAVTYSLLRAVPHDAALLQTLQRELELALAGSAPFWRRTTQAQSVWALACFISAGLAQGKSLREGMAPIPAAVCCWFTGCWDASVSASPATEGGWEGVVGTTSGFRPLIIGVVKMLPLHWATAKVE